jgi:ribonuclease HI
MTRVAQATPECSVYADGSCLGNPGPGGWGVVLIEPDGATREFAGANPSTTNNRMEITAALEALRIIPPGTAVVIHSDSQYLVKTMTLGWKRRENLDLWRLLDAEVATRRVRWEWVRGHRGDPGNERADELARSAAEGRAPRPRIPQGARQRNEVERASESASCVPGSESASCVPGSESASCVPGSESARRGQSKDPGSSMHELARRTANDRAAQPNPPSPDGAIAERIASLLGPGEEVRHCATCSESFVSAAEARHCSRIACQLQARTAN